MGVKVMYYCDMCLKEFCKDELNKIEIPEMKYNWEGDYLYCFKEDEYCQDCYTKTVQAIIKIVKEIKVEARVSN